MNHESSIRQFGFLEAHDVQLVRLGALAERYFHDDPNTCLIKLRQFAELLTQLIAAKTGLYEAGDKSQADLLRRLRFERVLPPQVADLFHTLRILGNNAAHGAAGTLSEALNALKYARQAVYKFNVTSGHCPKGKTEKVDCWPMPEVKNNLDMTTGKLGLSDQEENLIVAFLQTLTDGFTSPYSNSDTFTGTCMMGGSAATQGNEFLIPTPDLPRCASAVCGVAPVPSPPIP